MDPPVGEPVFREDVNGRPLPGLRPRRPLLVEGRPRFAGAAAAGGAGGQHVARADAGQAEERLVAGVGREEGMHAIV